MNTPQFWGALRGVLIALGGALTALGLVTATDWAQIVDHTIAIGSAAAGLALIVWPMVQAWRSRTGPALAKQAVEEAPRQVMQELASVPDVERIVTTSRAVAASIPSPKVVGPAG